MTITSIFAGADQPDIATLTTASGVTYWCFVWLAGGGSRVEAKIFTETEGGALVLVDAAVVATPDGTAVDCPRVLGVTVSNDEALFVVHWIDLDTGEETASLRRALFSVDAISTGWDPVGQIPLHVSLLYDAAPVVSAEDGGFVVTWRSAAGTITTARYESPWTWVDTAWVEADTGLTIADNVLACYAREDEVALVVYQSGNDLAAFRRNASDGQDYDSDPILADVLDGANNFTAVGITRRASDEYVVVAEVIPTANTGAGGYLDYSRAIAWGLVAPSNAAQLGDSQWCWNLHLLTRPWPWAAGTTGETEAYVGVSFKSIADGQEFDQQYGYVVRLDLAATEAASGSGVVKPVPCSAIMGGSVDARPHGSTPAIGVSDISIGKRLNHVSSVGGPPAYTLGPNVTATRFACIRWGRLRATFDANVELQPIEAGVGYVTYWPEPQWTVRRDVSQPTQPDTPQWTGESAAMCLPVETPAGLAFCGGVAAAYDGECLAELGFLWTPEIVAIEPTGAGGDMDVAATYDWYVNLVWPDGRGGFMRGPPSRPVSEAVVVNGFATLTVRCLNLTMAGDRRRYPLNAPISIEVWRTYSVGGDIVTEGSGDDATYLFRSEFGGTTTGYRIQDTPQNDEDAFTVDILVGRPNSIVQYNQLADHQLNLDTLQWVPPAPVPHQPLGPSTLWKNRLAGVDPESGSFVWSEPILPSGTRYRWPYYLDTNVLRLDSVGKVTAVANLDYAALAFTRDSTHAITGEPGAGGAGTNLDVQLVARGIGCIEPRSVIETHVGVFFQAAKGLHMVDRGLNVQYIGGPVEDLVKQAGNLRGGAHLADRHLVVWAFNEQPGTGPLTIRPRLLAYDYSTNRWSVWEYPGYAQSSTASRLNEMAGLAAVRMRQGQHVLMLLQQGGLALERSSTDTVYADEGAAATVAVGIDLQTEWLLLAEAAGVYRTREIGIVTQRMNASGMRVDLYFDRDGSFTETAPTDTPEWASPAPAYLPVKPSVQLFTAVMVRIRELNPASTENVRITNMMVRWMPKPYPRRPAGSTIGV